MEITLVNGSVSPSPWGLGERLGVGCVRAWQIIATAHWVGTRAVHRVRSYPVGPDNRIPLGSCPGLALPRIKGPEGLNRS